MSEGAGGRKRDIGSASLDLFVQLLRVSRLTDGAVSEKRLSSRSAEYVVICDIFLMLDAASVTYTNKIQLVWMNRFSCVHVFVFSSSPCLFLEEAYQASSRGRLEK